MEKTRRETYKIINFSSEKTIELRRTNFESLLCTSQFEQVTKHIFGRARESLDFFETFEVASQSEFSGFCLSLSLCRTASLVRGRRCIIVVRTYDSC